MKSTGGFNPMRWNCETRGCWNIKHRPKIEHFAHALPRKIAMSDIDAVTEINGHFLFMEWKSYQGELPTGQRILFQRLTTTSPKITVVVVSGDCETMKIDAVQVIKSGRINRWEQCTMDGLAERIEKWANRADVKVVGRAA